MTAAVTWSPATTNRINNTWSISNSLMAMANAVASILSFASNPKPRSQILNRLTPPAANTSSLVLIMNAFQKWCNRKAKPQKKRRFIRKVSVTMSRRRVIYLALRKSFMRDHPLCEVGKCTASAVDVHHKKGRGKHLNEVSTWMAVCRGCHNLIHNHPAWAGQHHYLLKRN